MHTKTLSLQSGGRLFVIGELFGHFPALGFWMRQVAFKPQLDKVVLLGNFLGYAASSRQAHYYLSQPWLEAVLGPNEAHVLDRLNRGSHSAEGTLIGQWLGGMSRDEKAMLQRALTGVPVALEWSTEEGLVVFSNRPMREDIPWEQTRSELVKSTNCAQGLQMFMSRIDTLRCLGMIPGGAQRPAPGVHQSIAAFSLEKPAATHHVRHNRIIITGSTCTAHGAQYNHQSLLCSVEINHLQSSIEQVNTWEMSLDVRHALYPASSLNTNMH
ncbi:serine/threonine protein phosphatase [Pseudomonas taiwanensis]|uniref:serine/threonine protein phosphatase n=1 Tax=Pseudomonas taiwanensis TaxID=470150 RepID=UPI0028DE53E7|nr:serine/threonine protein phosphatase [Pseudomonas taiwanensis]MDT8924956.1 serine/threonine protein phosphatase [Pseudomonas taiwanensis]